MTCPTPDLLARFAQGSLAEGDRGGIAEHVRGCRACREMVEPLRQSQRVTLPSAGSEKNQVLERGTSVGRYLILELLGSGAMGFVYQAFDPELDRHVALKLLRAKGSSDELRQRLIREAQAMAKLAHPNVVQVFDVGTTEGGDVFLAMERVDGTTLTEWCRAQRPYREVLRYFTFAGRGLAAAHAAGMVHRDFKPDNVLVAKDGRVRVTDFGLVRALPSGVRSDDELSTLTRDGTLLGTPNYMSPEQLDGAPIDARSDQFSFCVALYEGLYGERPFEAARISELLPAIRDGKVRPVPEGSAVPARVRRALLRGLSFAPADRFPSMAELFQALEHDPSRRWRRVATICASVVVGAVLVGGAEWLRHSATLECKGSADLSGVWDSAARRQLQNVFEQLHKGYADDLSRGLTERLDAYARAWAGASEQACRETRVTHAQSEQVLAMRRACLDQRKHELRALVQVISQAEPEALLRSVDAVERLRPASVCEGTHAPTLRASIEEQMHPKETDALREALASGRAEFAIGHYQQAINTLSSAMKAAPDLAVSPLAADVHYLSGRAEVDLSQLGPAARELTTSAELAERFADDELAVQAWSYRSLIDSEAAQFDRADEAEALAEAKLARLDSPRPVLTRQVLQAKAHRSLTSGDYAGAIKLYQRMLELPEPNAVDEAATREDLGAALKKLGRNSEARLQFEKGIALREAVQGKRHPGLVIAISNLAMIVHHEGDDATARALLSRAIDINEAAYGKDSAADANPLLMLAAIEADTKHYEKALAIDERVRDIRSAAVGPNHPNVADAWVNISDVLAHLDRLPDSEAALQQAIAIYSKGQPPHPNLGAAYINLAALQRMQSEYARSVESSEKGIALVEPRLGKEHAWIGAARQGLGISLLLMKKPREAAIELEKALAIQQKTGDSPAELSLTQFQLARALWDSGQMRPRSIELAKEALHNAVPNQPWDSAVPGDVEAWLKAHAPRSVSRAEMR